MNEDLINDRTTSNSTTSNSTTSNSTNSSICTICFNEYNNKKSRLNCNHIFCTECINTLINNKKYNCPLCRSLITSIVDEDDNITNIRNISLTMPRNSRIYNFINLLPILAFTLINIGIFSYSYNNTCQNIELCLEDCLTKCIDSNISEYCYLT